MKKTFALFILPGQLNQPLNPDTWVERRRRDVTEEREREKDG